MSAEGGIVNDANGGLPDPNVLPVMEQEGQHNNGTPSANLVDPTTGLPAPAPPSTTTTAFAKFNPLQEIDYIDTLVTVELLSLSANAPNSNDGLIAAQSFYETPTASLKTGNVIIIPIFKIGQQQTYESFLSPDVYFAVKSRSSDGKTIFLVKLQVKGSDDIASSILVNAGIRNANLVQLSSS